MVQRYSHTESQERRPQGDRAEIKVMQLQVCARIQHPRGRPEKPPPQTGLRESVVGTGEGTKLTAMGPKEVAGKLIYFNP